MASLIPGNSQQTPDHEPSHTEHQTLGGACRHVAAAARAGYLERLPRQVRDDGRAAREPAVAGRHRRRHRQDVRGARRQGPDVEGRRPDRRQGRAARDALRPERLPVHRRFQAAGDPEPGPAADRGQHGRRVQGPGWRLRLPRHPGGRAPHHRPRGRLLDLPWPSARHREPAAQAYLWPPRGGLGLVRGHRRVPGRCGRRVPRQPDQRPGQHAADWRADRGGDALADAHRQTQPRRRAGLRGGSGHAHRRRRPDRASGRARWRRAQRAGRHAAHADPPGGHAGRDSRRGGLHRHGHGSDLGGQYRPLPAHRRAGFGT